MQKLQNVSLMRVAAMILVVYYHCLCCYGVYKGDFDSGLRVDLYMKLRVVLYDFHVPTFAFLAGYLFGYQRFRGGYSRIVPFVKKKAVRVLCPYILVGLFMCMLQSRPISEMLHGVGHLWFLLAIFECYIVFRLIDFLYTKSRSPWIILISYAVLFVCSMWPPRELQAYGFLWLASYYSVGIGISRLRDFKWTQNRKLLSCLLIISVLLYLGDCFLFYRVFISRLLALNIIILVFLWLDTLRRNLVNSWIIKLDVASMGIYILHQILIQEINRLPFMRQTVVEYWYIYPHILFLVVFAISFGIVAFLKRYSWSKYIIG